jgi:gluconokinase
MTAQSEREATIGLDLGTSSIKVVAFDASGRAVAQAARPSGLKRSADGSAELDPTGVAELTDEALTEVVAAARHAGYIVRRVGISAAMHSLIPVAADGAPLMPAMTWADLRSQAEAIELWRSPAGPGLYMRTGTPIHAMAPLAKLLWLRRMRPEIFQQAAMYAGLKEWLWRRWFGEWAVDDSMASAMGLYNLATEHWDAEALALAGVTTERLPRLVPTTYARADLPDGTARRLGLDDRTLFVMGASDGVLANLGVGAVDGRQLTLTAGTSLAARRGVAAPTTDPATLIFCYALGPSRFICGAASNNGGDALEWLYRSLLTHWSAPKGSLSQALEEARTARADDLVFLPYIAGERVPFWSDATLGALVGLRAEHTAADALRAAIEGVLFNAAWLIEQVTANAGPPDAVIATGGVFQSAWIAELGASIFGLPVTAAGAEDASARGAALLAEIAAGIQTWESATALAAGQSAQSPNFAPNSEDSERYRRNYQRFRALASALEPVR